MLYNKILRKILIATKTHSEFINGKKAIAENPAMYQFFIFSTNNENSQHWKIKEE